MKYACLVKYVVKSDCTTAAIQIKGIAPGQYNITKIPHLYIHEVNMCRIITLMSINKAMPLVYIAAVVQVCHTSLCFGGIVYTQYTPQPHDVTLTRYQLMGIYTPVIT